MDAKFKPLNLTDDEITDLKVMRDHFWQEDIATRQIQLQKWRRLKFYWNNITNVWYDSVAHDWRIWNNENYDGQGDSDQAYYDQRINVFKGFLESIFAALSVVIPPVRAYPDDAENSSDLETAKAGDKIASLLYRHNEAPLLWLHSLYVYGTEGLTLAHNYVRHDKSYGTYPVDEYQEEILTHRIELCPICQEELSDEIINPEDMEMVENQETSAGIQQEGQVNPLSDESEVDGLNQQEAMEICPLCNSVMIPLVNFEKELYAKLVGSVDEPKGRVCIETKGGLNCKIPIYARTQEQVLYLFDCYETHWANAIEMFPKLHDKLQSKMSGNQSGSFDSYEQWARLNTEYRGEYPVNCVTIKNVWFKCAAYNILTEDRMKHWKRKYPNGVRATFVNDLFAEAKREALDEHWTLMVNPLSDFLSTDPIGMLLTSVQDIINDLNSLTKQTIEHGVGLTFVDPQVVDLNAYLQTEVSPGALIPTKPISGNKKIGDGFFEIKTATLSGEVMPFGQQIQTQAELASGAMPALFGRMDAETASQDSMAKSQAQSRLGMTWKFFCIWWKNIFGKAIPQYISIIQVDERDVRKREDGSFINIVIKKSELSGKIGRVELEANENLPMSWSQRKDVIMQLLLSPNPQIIQMLMQPENLPILREAIGLDNFFVPGADDVDKQWAEIQMLINSAPLPNIDEELDIENSLNPMLPSVEIDVLMDTHPTHFEICRKWAVSEVGQYYKYNKPEEYQNVILHAKQHLDAMNLGMPQQQLGGDNSGQANPPKSKQSKSKREAPITGDVDVPTVQ